MKMIHVSWFIPRKQTILRKFQEEYRQQPKILYVFLDSKNASDEKNEKMKMCEF